MITVENQLFSLHTRHTSYLFRVMETGHLEHLYYGRKIHPAIDGLMEQHAFAPGNTNIYDSEHLQRTHVLRCPLSGKAISGSLLWN